MKANERNLESIPGVGKRIAEDLRDIGVDRPSYLKGKNPEQLYAKLCKLRGQHIDRCMLYTFRCAIYYVNNRKHDPEKMKWWYWKDQR